MERGDLAEFGKKNATQMMIFLPIENVGRKIKMYLFISRHISDRDAERRFTALEHTPPKIN